MQGWVRHAVPIFTGKLPAANFPGFGQLTDDAAGTSIGVFTYAFDATTEEYLFMAITGSSNYLPGTDFIPEVVWASKTTEENKVVAWGAEVGVSLDGSNYGDTATLTGTSTGNVTACEHRHTFLTTVDGSALTTNDNSALFRLYRDVSEDTFTGDIYLIGMNVWYYASGVGQPGQPT